MPITESRSPTHRTRADARIGEGRVRADGGHVAGHVGKAASSPVSISRRDAQPDNPSPPEEPFRSNTSVVVGENRGVIQDSRRR